MKRVLNILICFLACIYCSAQKIQLEKDFITPPESVQTAIYWYWISDNISKEGVIKDLQAMKKAGINRAFIGNIGLSDVPYGPHKIFSDEWWDIMHTALKTAGDSDIEIGIFNSPGWSQSGGPWVKAEQSMRYLASSEIRVTGPQKLSQTLDKPSSDFEDVRVLAWPVAKTYRRNLLDEASQLLISTGSSTAELKPNAPIQLSSGKETVVDVILSEPANAKSIVIHPTPGLLQRDTPGGSFYECCVQTKSSNEYRTISTFIVDRTNGAPNVGFSPFAPIAESFEKVKSREFRLIFRNIRRDCSIEKLLLTDSPVVERYAEKTLGKMFQSEQALWDVYMWRNQPEENKDALCIAPNQVQDISKYFSKDGRLNWDVPKGEWIIQRTGMANTGTVNAPATPEGQGREVDKLSKKHTVAHFDAFIGEIMRRIPKSDRKTFRVVVVDSYECAGQNFTDDFLLRFKKRYGYDALPWLPAYQGHAIGNPELSNRFLWDVRRLVADGISYEYARGLREISNRHGLITWQENYGHWGFAGEFLQYGGQCDEIGGEFWCEENYGDIEIKAAASCANIYGKKKASAESFTSNSFGNNNFYRHPAYLKRRGDWSFVEGVNDVVLHVYIQQPKNEGAGIHAWFGTEFNRLNTWFSHVDLFVDYIKRCNLMLQQGLNVADVAYFIGEDAPKMTGIRDPELPRGYSYDYINAEVIEKSMTVKDGKLTLPHGTSYRVLVLPKQETMRPELLKKIESLVMEGAVVVGPPPSRSPSMQNYPQADLQVQKLAKKVWGNMDGKSSEPQSYGKGLVFHGANLEQVFARINVVPDCILPDYRQVLFAHRASDNMDIYFLCNQTDQTIQVSPEFRIAGKQPELWDAVTGKKRDLPSFIQKDGTTEVPLQFEPAQSMFIVFKRPGTSAVCDLSINFPKQETFLTINSPWTVHFESDAIKRGPKAPVTFAKLEDWTQNANDSIRYFSGTAVYQTSFELNTTETLPQLTLDLGKVGVMAKVKLNGTYVGGVWTMPYTLDVAKFVKPGKNTLEVEVVNTWQNRMIGDDPLPPDKRPVTPHSGLPIHTKLTSSGLFGPVRLLIPSATTIE